MKTTFRRGILIITGMFFLWSGVMINAQNIKDMDGNQYIIVTLGRQIWTASNLAVTHFRNGDVINQAKTEDEWIKALKDKTPAWCYYGNDDTLGNKYGKLYNWYAINDQRGLAPEGWHIPAVTDWKTLVQNLLGISVAGEKLKSKSDWKRNAGTDKIGFHGLPAGYRNPEGKFTDLGRACQWWANTVPVSMKPSDNIYSLLLDDRDAEVKYIQVAKGTGLAVRCVKD